MRPASRFELLLIALIVLVAAIGVRAAYQPADPVGAIERAESIYGLDLGNPHPWFSAWALGDGQAYALIAADISGRKLADNIHEAAYRFARAGYGWAAAVFVLGKEHLIPYGLAAAGALAVVGVVLLTARLRRRLGPRAWLILLNPALFLGFGGDTSEPLGILLLVIGMGWNSRVTAMLLGVTRPTFLIAVCRNWRLFLVGVGAALALGIYSLFAFGSESFIPDGGRIGLPFVSYIEHLSPWGLLLGIAASITMLIGVSTRDWAWVLAGVFVLCFGSDVLRDPTNAWRAAGFLSVLWGFGPGFRSIPRLATTLDPVATDADVASRRLGR